MASRAAATASEACLAAVASSSVGLGKRGKSWRLSSAMRRFWNFWNLSLTAGSASGLVSGNMTF